MKNYDLGTEKIGRLVRHFSVPCVISMLVAALYNIVDQIFIGWSPAGAFGNAATNIVYPFTVLALGLSLLVGDGAAANFSLESGRKNKDRADKSVGNGFLLSTHDLATYNNIQAISDAGITSLKLEGRMKSGDYIGTIVNSYRNIIDGNPGDWKKDLHLVFNRQFTNGYIMNDQPGDVMGRGSSGHEGLYIGDITNIDGTKVTIEIKNKEILHRTTER